MKTLCPECSSANVVCTNEETNDFMCIECGAEFKPAGDERIVKDANGNPLAEGDSVVLIKSLDVKGTSFTLKKGMVIKNIHITDDDETIECKVENTRLVLKTCFLKKG